MKRFGEFRYVKRDMSCEKKKKQINQMAKSDGHKKELATCIRICIF